MIGARGDGSGGVSDDVDQNVTQNFPYAAILFDMDGVLVDSEPIHEASLAEMYAARGWAVADPRFRSFKGRTAADVFGALARETGAAAAEITADKRARYDALFARDGRLVPGVTAVLEALAARGVPLALATSGHRAEVDAVFARFGIGDHFAATIAGEDVTRSKPHPEPYLRAAAALGDDAARCLVVEDTLHGVAAGVAAGATVAAITGTFPAADLVDAGAAWTFDTFADFAARLGV